jgi:hypothetical protein
VYGAIPKDDKGIAILTRWILDVLLDLSSDIEVPAVDVEEKRVTPTYVEKGTTGEKIPPLIRVLSSSEKHADAFVSIRYRNSWFWIDDRDFRSKKTFSFLMFIFTLVETGEKGTAPVLTLPTG